MTYSGSSKLADLFSLWDAAWYVQECPVLLLAALPEFQPSFLMVQIQEIVDWPSLFHHSRQSNAKTLTEQHVQ